MRHIISETERATMENNYKNNWEGLESNPPLVLSEWVAKLDRFMDKALWMIIGALGTIVLIGALK